MLGEIGGGRRVKNSVEALRSASGLLGRRRAIAVFALPLVIAMVSVAAFGCAWGHLPAINAVENAQTTAETDVANLRKASEGEIPQEESTAFADGQEEVLASSRLLDVLPVLQYPELPTGCESVALTSVLSYYGFKLEKTEIAENWLLTSDDDFVHAFLGDPFDDSGQACMAPALVAAADDYLSEQDSSLRAYDLTGSSFVDLLELVAKGTPVIVWCTVDLDDPDDPYDATYEGGFEYELYANSHCVALRGYDLDTGLVYVSDPLVGQVSYPIDVFATRYYELGAQAICLS